MTVYICTLQGESMVYCYELSSEAPYLFELSHFSSGSQHQSLSYFPKSVLDVKDVEFNRALRLTTHSIETVSFTVPRIKVRIIENVSILCCL